MKKLWQAAIALAFPGAVFGAIFGQQAFREYPSVEYGRSMPLPADWQKEASPIGAQASIAVQARQTLEESRWLLQLAGRFLTIKGVAGWVDLRSENIGDQLTEFSRYLSTECLLDSAPPSMPARAGRVKANGARVKPQSARRKAETWWKAGESCIAKPCRRTS